MKLSLKISILLNVVALAGWIFYASTRTPVVPAPTSVAISASPAPVASIPAPAPLPPSPAPFRWQQLDSADYHDYVKKLRAIECPEATLRAIVRADVHAAYQVRYNALAEKLSDLDKASWSAQFTNAGTETALKNELNDLPAEESAEIADLLGLKPATTQLAASSSPATNDDDADQDPTPASMPLVFQNIDPVALGLSDEQMQAVDKLRQDFVAQVGGSNQDPNDPAYLARWQQAQPAADAMLRGTLGTEAYSKYLLSQVMTPNAGAAAQ